MRAHGAVGARGGEGALHLAADLVLADDHRLETRGDREEVLQGGVALENARGRTDGPRVVARRVAERVEHRVGRRRHGIRLHLEVGLEAIAGGEHDRPRIPGRPVSSRAVRSVRRDTRSSTSNSVSR
ncbi:hypothetical protein GCM10025881_19140 [Pseudolysinimonas kribbensis]|uniref:Uncharacterized protein n=1 Tax=Pseudolysinimonas kribbensis TaxID=433641 RepID=A0ABQ6K656_9MICO|nr:hypothetical protein GCM10025881_19140 [Pseudolysinimonas kribbensis]